MQIGKVIRKYRKEKNMTQEEMAQRLGVTAPAVNKWENGNSLPDITMLAPLARLLDITIDTLLSFHEELTEEEIRLIIREADERLEKETYEEVFQWAKKKIEIYPNCKMLIWQLAVILDAQRLFKNVPNAENYDAYILDCYERVLDSEDEKTRNCAADSLYGYYLRKEQYEKAEEYLTFFSEQNPERKRKQAIVYSRTNRVNQAYKAYEELLFSGYQMLSATFNGMYILAMQDKDMEKAHKLVDKQQELAVLFEMGKYYEVSCRLELATVEKDADTILEIMEAMLSSIEHITDFSKSSLYEHMTFKKKENRFIEELKNNLLTCFQDEETYGFLKGNERWKNLSIERSKPSL